MKSETQAGANQLYEGDFVRAETQFGEAKYSGTVINKRSANDVVTGYDVQIWDSDGPKTRVYTFTPPEVSLHEQGRLSIIDNSSQKRFNNR